MKSFLLKKILLTQKINLKAAFDPDKQDNLRCLERSTSLNAAR